VIFTFEGSNSPVSAWTLGGNGKACECEEEEEEEEEERIGGSRGSTHRVSSTRGVKRG